MRFITFRLKYAVMAIALVLLITLSAFTAAAADAAAVYWSGARSLPRSEEHTSELQSQR